MKKFATLLVLILFIMIPNPTAYAKSYTIDDVQIRGWVEPNGDIFVNEIFTYTLEGQFTEFTRSFPKEHLHQIDEFGASTINVEQPVVGYLSEDVLTPVAVRKETETYVASVHANNETVSIFYKYYLRNAVKSYETYSDIHITYFETGSNHKIDFNNVHISYVLPDEVGETNIHGFLYDQSGTPPQVYEDWIIFETPKSRAYTETSTRVLFPSSVMTEQKKGKAPVSFERAIELEEKMLQSMRTKLSLIPQIGKSSTIVGALFLVLGIAIFLLYRQRRYSLYGNRDLVMNTDLVYLFFVDHNGQWQPKSFLAGLFSIAEKGYANVLIEPSAKRFQKELHTLAFELNQSKQNRLPHEELLVSWLFTEDPENQKFHLHDVAGASKDELAQREMYQKKQYKFEVKYKEWHDEVKQLMNEAGTFSEKLSQVVKIGVIFLTVGTLVAGFIAELKPESLMMGPLIFGALTIGAVMRKKQQLSLSVLFFGIMTFLSFQIHDEALSGGMLFLVLTGALLYFVTPTSILTSLNALRTKMSIVNFRRQVRNGMSKDLTEEEQVRWLTRVYVLNHSKSKLPKMKGTLSDSLPLAPLFAGMDDPFHFVESTWGPSKVFGTSGEDSRNYNHSDGGSSGGSSGGGGAGAR